VSAGLRVLGNASAEELAVVLALVSQREREPAPDRYAQWRRTRLAALRERAGG